MLDAVDPDSISQLAAVINQHKTPEVINIHNLRIIRSGNFHHIDAHLVLPQFLDVATAHHISEQFEHKVVKDYKFEGEFAFHVDPCKQKLLFYLCDE